MSKQRRLEAAVQAIQHKHGPQALRKGARPAATAVPSLSTGLPSLDRALAIGGLPLGHISEWIGQPTSGKRTLALYALHAAQTQRPGHTPCVYIDLARTFDPAYAAACHVDLARLVIAAPASPAQALDLAGDLASSGHFGLIVFDSTAELRTAGWPANARAAGLRRLGRALAGQPSALLFLTSADAGEPGAPIDRPASFDLAPQAALRLAVSRQRWLRRCDGSIGGYEARVTVLRSRWSEAGRSAVVRITLNGVHLEEQ